MSAARFAAISLLMLSSACQLPDAVRHLGETPPTPHARYAQSLRDAGLAETALGREWLVAADTALRAAHRVVLPFHEVGYYDRAEARAVAWQFELREGARLAVSLMQDGLPAQLFVDLFEQEGDSVPTYVHRAFADGDSGLRHDVRTTATYVLRVQPELLRSGRFEITMTTEPQLAFPVDGRGNGAVQSFFGAVRDGGRRDHHGIDIFAPRGTPVLAATDGVVRSTRPNRLGGNVVWLADADRGQSLYYAHLDSHNVSAGQRVRRGDTVGFIGNSGNARTTSPHLHFGIYRRGQGPVDPWPYVRRVTATPPRIRADTGRLGGSDTVRTRVAIRTSPAASAPTTQQLGRNTPLRIMGAASSWYRVLLDNGVAGYVPAAQLR